MNLINDLCVAKYKPSEDTVECVADNWPYNPDIKKPSFDMTFNTGSLPPNCLMLKPGCVLMLLRNWKLSEGNLIDITKFIGILLSGLANGTRLRLLEISPKRAVIKCEVITGPRVKKPVVNKILYVDLLFVT